MEARKLSDLSKVTGETKREKKVVDRQYPEHQQ